MIKILSSKPRVTNEKKVLFLIHTEALIFSKKEKNAWLGYW